MKIGFETIYAWRPHVEHLMFLARLVGEAGHTPVFLACDADLSACYTRELRDVRPDWMECLLCRAGGVRSYTSSGVSAIGDLAHGQFQCGEDRARDWSSSSASTLGRFESAVDYETDAFIHQRERLVPAVAKAYDAAREWIAREKLDALCVFNGRMDVTRAIFEAARDASIRVVTLERSWSGDGIQLLPDENCLGLQSVHAMVGEWSAKPLTGEQARAAAARIAARVTATNTTEWRAYNQQSRSTDWPVAGNTRRVLLLPGSMNEIWGHPDWRSGWKEPTAAYDALISKLGLRSGEYVLRCHPNWAERIGRNDGHMAERYYAGWGQRHGAVTIASADRTSTMNLIAQSDLVVIAGSSAGLEAAAMGKPVVSTAEAPYRDAGFRMDATTPAALAALALDASLRISEAEQLRLRRMGLRYSYTTTHRLPQYVNHIRALSSSAYRYEPGADPQRFVDLIRTGQLQPDDDRFAADPREEDAVVAAMAAGEWQALRGTPGPSHEATGRVRRRWMFQPLDYIREKMPVGDR